MEEQEKCFDKIKCKYCYKSWNCEEYWEEMSKIGDLNG